MNIEQRKEIGICGVTVTFTIAELIVLKGMNQSINEILTPNKDKSSYDTKINLRTHFEKLTVLLNKITTGIQSLDEAANEMFSTQNQNIERPSLEELKLMNTGALNQTARDLGINPDNYHTEEALKNAISKI